jgi:hypothetical protein
MAQKFRPPAALHRPSLWTAQSLGRRPTERLKTYLPDIREIPPLLSLTPPWHPPTWLVERADARTKKSANVQLARTSMMHTSSPRASTSRSASSLGLQCEWARHQNSPAQRRVKHLHAALALHHAHTCPPSPPLPVHTHTRPPLRALEAMDPPSLEHRVEARLLHHGCMGHMDGRMWLPCLAPLLGAALR